MSELPNGWASCHLSDVVDDAQAGFASGKKDVKEGLSHLRMNNISVDGKLNFDLIRTVPRSLASQNHYLRKGDVLICTTNSGTLVGKSALFNVEGEFAFSNHLTRLRVKPQSIHSSYLHHQLWLLWKNGGFERKCKHWVNQSTLPKDELLSTEILIPPLNEQQRIVVKLEKLLNRVEAAQARLATIPLILKRFRESVLAVACSGHLTADWREQNKSIFPAELQIKDNGFNLTVSEDELETLPATWKWVPLGNYGKCSRGRFSIRPRNDPRYFGGEYPFIQIGDLPPEGGLITSHDQTLNEMGLGVSKCFPKGTVVIAIVGATIGNTGILSYDMCFTDSMVGIETGSEIGNVYVELFLRSRKDNIRQSSYAGGGQPNIKLETLNPFPLALPPFPEQQEIVRRVGALFKTADALEARYRKAKAYVDKLTQSILAKAFRGELVPQDPSDEPATVLEKLRSTPQ